MPVDFDGKRVIVTGAAGGFGRTTAEAFAEQGARVVVADIDRDGAQHVAAGIPGAVATGTDVTNPEAVQGMIETAVHHFGGVDVLVNNAGAPHRMRPLEELTVEDFDRQFALNVRAVFLGCKFVVPVMRAAGWGVIVNVASIGASRPRPGLTLYNSAKGAVLTMTRALAVEVAPVIRVCAVSPVSAATGFGQHATGELTLSPSAERAVIAGIPMGRRATPRDVADSVLFLASDKARFLTGVCLDIDGGRSIQ
jgi:3-oxoacyl-[acyl-carrier protein] reductase